MLTCCAGIELLSITVECVLDQLLGGHIISIFFPYSLPLPLFPCLSGFPSLTFSFITFHSASLKWLGSRLSGIWIFSALAWNAEGPDVARDTIFPLSPCQRVKWLWSQQRCINLGQRGLLTQMPAHSCGSISTFAYETPQSFWKSPSALQAQL